ncbi:MAG: lipid A biosynthesis acyltransferase [Acidobacteria bacterium]|nr:MAG: lipid A biosynthesis acyltransferase [Acidobacteriota bacterium]
MGKRGQTQTIMEYAAARGLLGALGVLPRPAAVAAGRALGRLAHMLGGGLRRTGEINLQLAFPDMDERQRKQILRGCYDSLGRTLGEFSQFPRATRASLRELIDYDPVGLKHLRAAEAAGRGVIFLTGHLGAWEVLSFAWSALEYPISFIVRPLDNLHVEKLIEGIRTRFGNTAINKTAAARQALRVLRAGGTLGILADLNTQEKEGVFVPFFDRLACTTTGAAMLALRANAIVIPTCAIWDKKRGRYFFHGDPPVELVRTGDEKREIEINTANFTAAIERMVRAYPDQWLWIHKRWHTRPAGELSPYQRQSRRSNTSRLTLSAVEKDFSNR